MKNNTPVENLLDESVAGTSSCYYTELPVYGQINILPQPRKTFFGISDLAISIALHRVIEPPTVVRWNEKACAEYLALINEVWGTTWAMSELVSTVENGESFFYVLLAGERRTRALRLLWDEGCPVCQETFGRNKKPGECFLRHFHCDQIEVGILKRSPGALEALEIQQTENSYRPVPAYEEAWSFVQMYRVFKKRDPNFSVAALARKIGRSPDTVRKAIRYVDLPEKIQEMVQEGDIAYGLAIEACRLKEAKVSDETIIQFVIDAAASNYTVPQFRDVVLRYLDDLRSGQIHFFGDEDVDLIEISHRQRKRVVEEKSVRGFYASVAYIQAMSRLVDKGLLGTGDLPYSSRSPRRALRKLTDCLEVVQPELKLVATEAAANEISEVSREVAETLATFPDGSD